MNKQTIKISIIAVISLILVFVLIKFIAGTEGNCSCPSYSRPAPCEDGEVPVFSKPAKMNWYCNEVCSSPPSCDLQD